jgi:predicted ATPase
MDLPAGTVTFLFTDVEGSTGLLQELGAEGYAEALAEHRRLIRQACARHDGVEVDTQGDAFFFAFPTGPGAVSAAKHLTDALARGPIRVRVGLHTGQPLVTSEGYVGEDVHVAARVAASAHAGQVVLSGVTARIVDVELTDLGEHRLKDIDGPVSMFQLGEERFPPLRTISNTNLPRPPSSFVGRERELEEVLSRIEAGARLVTLTGPGGSGKTRVAIEAAASLVPSFKAGVFWVGLASLRDPALVTETIARTIGAKDGLQEHIGTRELLLLLDNLEQVIDAAPELASLLGGCPNLTLLVTSRELLRVQGELEYPVPPLAEAEAVSLFCARAQLEPTEEIAELCRRLDNLPLAVELAAARTKSLSPAQIRERLAQRLDLLKGGRDADPRQQTLRATIEWSDDLLSDDEKQLFHRLSVFAGGCTLEAAEDVCAADLDTLQSLVEKSLLRLSNERFWMLETIREYAWEQLDSPERDAVRRRHRAYVVALAEASADELHTAAESAASARLAPDYANIRAAVSSALAVGEPDDVGRILGAVYPFLISHGHLAEAREWAEAALAARDRLSERGLAETLVGGGEIARFAGDFGRATALKEELASLHGDVQRPNWRAATMADLCEIALEQGEFERAREYAEQSATAGGGARAVLCFAELSLRLGELDTAEANGLAALAGLDEGAFNHATCMEILGETARRAGNEALARERFCAALRSFAALNDGGGLADCLDGLSRLAAAADDGGRAGRLLGAAQNLREERGRRPIRTDVPLPDAPASDRDEGRALSFEDAVHYAQQGCPFPGPPFVSETTIPTRRKR